MDHREILAGQNVAVRHRNARVHHVATGGHVARVCGHVVDGDGAARNGGGVGRAGVPGGAVVEADRTRGYFDRHDIYVSLRRQLGRIILRGKVLVGA